MCKNHPGPLLANASQPIRPGCESDPACLLDADIGVGVGGGKGWGGRCRMLLHVAVKRVAAF